MTGTAEPPAADPVPEPDDGRGREILRAIREFVLGERRGYRDIWLLIITGFMFLALMITANNVGEIEAGRRAGTGFTCAIAGAVATAGREVVEDSASQPLPPKLEKILGLPPLKVRQQQARATGRLYTEHITLRLEQVAGISKAKAQEIILPDGTVDCQRLKALSKVR